VATKSGLVLTFCSRLSSLALLAVATRERDHKSTVPYDTAATLWASGTVLFSGSIYGLSLGAAENGFKILGPITPLGGLLMISGWACLGFGTDTYKPE
jgi:uncharacterized membrane protein YgdD (TMEM256/DUF423 family)